MKVQEDGSVDGRQESVTSEDANALMIEKEEEEVMDNESFASSHELTATDDAAAAAGPSGDDISDDAVAALATVISLPSEAPIKHSSNGDATERLEAKFTHSIDSGIPAIAPANLTVLLYTFEVVYINAYGSAVGPLIMKISSKQPQSIRSVTNSSLIDTKRTLPGENSDGSFSPSSDFEILEKQVDFLRNDRQKLLNESRLAMEQQCDTNRDLRRVMKAYKCEAETCRKVPRLNSYYICM